MANKQTLTNVIPALINYFTDQAIVSERQNLYADELAPLIARLQSRFQELSPTDDELQLSIDMEAKIIADEQISKFLQQTVLPAYRLRTKADAPEWLLPKHKKTADFYAEAFAQINNLDQAINDLINSEAEPGISIDSMKQTYLNWKKINDAQIAKSDILKKAAEIVDIKQMLIGALRLLDVDPQDINNVIYQAGGLAG